MNNYENYKGRFTYLVMYYSWISRIIQLKK